MNFSKDWINILNEVKQMLDHSNGHVCFRGMCDARFKLNSGIFRNNLSIRNLRELERSNYHLFRNMGMLDHEKSDWDLLYVMQHHGVKTRLLDWTESFAVALFFAYSTWEQKTDAVVWVLKPSELNKRSNGGYGYRVLGGPTTGSYFEFIHDNEKTSSVAVFPVKNNKRVVAQQGVFTLQGNGMIPLEDEQDGAYVKEGTLRKIVIPKQLASDVESFLSLSGINYYTLFPDLDGLANYVNNRNTFGKSEKIINNIPELPEVKEVSLNK